MKVHSDYYEKSLKLYQKSHPYYQKTLMLYEGS